MSVGADCWLTPSSPAKDRLATEAPRDTNGSLITINGLVKENLVHNVIEKWFDHRLVLQYAI